MRCGSVDGFLLSWLVAFADAVTLLCRRVGSVAALALVAIWQAMPLGGIILSYNCGNRRRMVHCS